MSSPEDTDIVPTHSVTITLTTGEPIQANAMELIAQYVIANTVLTRKIVIPEDAEIGIYIKGLSRRRRRSRAYWLKKGASLTLSFKEAEVSNILGESLIENKVRHLLASLGITEISTDIKALA